ncbi:hypothetical protein BMS3Bbin04_01516 [bacterium BMS3Bbin04]|nr:hypothetical protein BMS3Bbin04_01516 [bacterium BMS3Bbin04]
MLSEMLQSVTGLGGYTTAGMVIFFVTFIVLTVRALRVDKSFISYMSKMPIDSSDSDFRKENK